MQRCLVKFRVEFASTAPDVPNSPFSFFLEKNTSAFFIPVISLFLSPVAFSVVDVLINLVAVSSEIHRAEVGAARVEKFGLFNHIARPAGAYLLGCAASLRAVDGQGSRRGRIQDICHTTAERRHICRRHVEPEPA